MSGFGGKVTQEVSSGEACASWEGTRGGLCAVLSVEPDDRTSSGWTDVTGRGKPNVFPVNTAVADPFLSLGTLIKIPKRRQELRSVYCHELLSHRSQGVGLAFISNETGVKTFMLLKQWVTSCTAAHPAV